MCCSLFFGKILVCRSAYFPNKELQYRCCSLNFPKFSTALLHVVWIELFKVVVSRTRFPMKELNFSHNLLVAKFFTKFASGSQIFKNTLQKHQNYFLLVKMQFKFISYFLIRKTINLIHVLDFSLIFALTRKSSNNFFFVFEPCS